MFFLDAFQAPVQIAIKRKDGKMLIVDAPLMTIEQIVDWANHVLSQNYNPQLEGMDQIQQKEFRLMYPPIQPDLTEMRRRIRTPEGISRILSACLVNAPTFNAISSGNGSPPEKGDPLAPLNQSDVDHIVKVTPPWVLEMMAYRLSGMVQELPAKTAGEKADGSDPLARSGEHDLKHSPETGQKTSPSSVLPTPTETIEKSPSTFFSPSSSSPETLSTF